MPLSALQLVLNTVTALVAQVVITCRILTSIVALGELEFYFATVAIQIQTCYLHAHKTLARLRGCLVVHFVML